MYKKYCLWLSLTFFVIFGCAHRPGNRTSEEKTLRDKVTQEWEAKVHGEWGTVYELTTREFKNSVTRDAFVSGKNLRIENFSIQEITVDSAQEKAVVQVSFDINHMGIPFKGASTREEWMREEGEWRLNLKPRRTPFD